MLKIPDTYYKNNEDYITLAVIRKFVDTHPNGKFKRNATRQELLDDILAYGGQNDTCKEAVLTWIDEVLQEGIKDIYLQYMPLPEEMNVLFSTQESVERHLQGYIDASISRHICENQYGKDYVLVFAIYSEDEYGRRITFTYCKKLYIYDKNKRSAKPVDYPVNVDYFLDQEWLLVRAKPRSNLYLYEYEEFNLDIANRTTTDQEIHEVMHLVERILGTKAPRKSDKSAMTGALKNRIFKLLDKYSQTPVEIARVISNHGEQIQRIFSLIQEICIIKNVCILPEWMKKDVMEDVSNTVEKYLSINWKDKKVFMQDRDAYPIRISATDEEESKVEQTAALTEPLQMKAVFFDNKKMLYKSKSCDGVSFRWKRKNVVGGQNQYFSVRITISSKGECVFKFTEYTAKEDIENVVFSIISG